MSKTVLVVDDEEPVREMLREFLQNAGLMFSWPGTAPMPLTSFACAAVEWTLSSSTGLPMKAVARHSSTFRPSGQASRWW